MLYPSQLNENEYVCLFMVKTDEEGNPVYHKDGTEIKFHKYVKKYEQYEELIKKYKYNYHIIR